jgi:lysosomal Pro-X carboxypeptidase
LDPPYDSNGFARVVTKDAGPKCAAAVKTGLQTIESLGKTKDGRDKLSKIFNLCRTLDNVDDVDTLMAWTSSYWDYLAMGDFPYPSRYVQPEGGILPAYPVKAACQAVLKAADPVSGLASGANLFYNATGKKKCLFNDAKPILSTTKQGLRSLHSYKIRSEVLTSSRSCAGDWDWQWCTEHNMPFTSGTDRDMFYPPTGPFDPTAAAVECKKTWGVAPNPLWARLTYGGIDGLRQGLTNVVFSNGLLDPWSAGGILDTKGFHPSVVSVLIPHGAHHIDLMFSTDMDPIDVKLARSVELIHISKWIDEAQKKRKIAQEDVGDYVVSSVAY